MEVSARNNLPLEDYVLQSDTFDSVKLQEAAVLLFDKPVDWSSFKLVKKIKYFSKANRVGHAGTLDPLATGLLVICTGKCTKMIEQIQDMEKTYTGVFNFGKTTPSHDLETAFDGDFPFEHITEAMIQEAVLAFTGEIEQTPPAYSAIKVNGTRAYKKARLGEEVKIKSRKITVYEFKVSGNLPHLSFEVKCSKGTYIRTLAADFAAFLGSGAYLTDLKRTAIGPFHLNHAFDLNKFQELCAH